MNVLTLSRLQFSLTVMFHYLFPPLSIGLAILLVLMETLYLKTKDTDYERMAKFWTKIFGVNFAMGTATGVVMEFQFGTNWATYSRYVGDIFGSALAAEGIFAFFLESGFLAVLVFGWDRVSPKVHWFSSVMVSLGSIFSAVWIVIANSWQQTPAGFHIVGAGLRAHAEITDFRAMIFNPSSMVRLQHVLLGAFLMGAFFVMSVTAFYILKERHVELAKKNFRVALALGFVSSTLLLVSGHAQARKLAVTQPAKLAAFEGVYRSGPYAPLHLVGIPDDVRQRVAYGLELPGLLSVLVGGRSDSIITGLDAFRAADLPPVGLSFQSYHAMVALGMFFIAITWASMFFAWHGTLFEKKWLLRIFVGAVLAAVAANQLGWVAAEVGRQPWIVYGLLRTSDALSKVVTAEQVLGSIVMFTLIYLMLLFVWLYVVDNKIKHGPEEAVVTPPVTPAETLIDTMAELADPAGPSMTDARE